VFAGPLQSAGQGPPGSGGEGSHFQLWYLHIWLTQTSRTLPMEVHLGVALGQQGTEA
jgi:hypothetical protein